MQIRTVSAVLIWIVAALLILNMTLKSGWILVISIAMMVIAVAVYFTPRLKK